MSLTLPPSAKIYLSLAPCDMRKGFDGLSAQVRNILQLDRKRRRKAALT